MKRLFVSILAILLVGVSGSRKSFAENSSTTRPNLILIVSDDQRFDTLGRFMPVTQTRIFDTGAVFDSAYVTTPACCPSRSSILTGLYASHHGVHTNGDPLVKPTFVELLHKNGYFTGIVGKYLNSWGGEPRPEFDYWVSFKNGSVGYQRPVLNVQGEWKSHSGHINFRLSDYLQDFLKNAKNTSKPFFLMFTPNSPHWPATPPKRDRELFSDLAPYRPASYGSSNLLGKPNWVKQFYSHPNESQRTDVFRLKQLQVNWSLDEVIGRLLDKLTTLEMLENTVVAFISDNGVYWGEHGLRRKDAAYQEAIHVPFAISSPRYIGKPQLQHALVANIDIAPTFLDLAGVKDVPTMDGLSLLPLIARPTVNWRDALLIEGWMEREGKVPFIALHTGDWVYIETPSENFKELYDLKADPFQTNNLLLNGSDVKANTIAQNMREKILSIKNPASEVRNGHSQ